jgi:hypothetical protein
MRQNPLEWLKNSTISNENSSKKVSRFARNKLLKMGQKLCF